MNCSLKNFCLKCGNSALMINALENKLICDICKIEMNTNTDKKKRHHPSNADNQKTHYNNKMKELLTCNVENDINFPIILAKLEKKGIKHEDVEC